MPRSIETRVRARDQTTESPADRVLPKRVMSPIMRGMLWGERVTRRRALVGLLVVFALADAALAYAVIQADAGAAVPVAQPLHPVIGDFRPDETRLSDCTDQRCFQQAFG